MLQELAFTGQWRHYQKRVLDKSDALWRMAIYIW